VKILSLSAVADEAGCFEPGFSSVSAVIKVDCLAKECPTNDQRRSRSPRHATRGLSCELDLTR
jgi:hypothetical protein